MFGNLFRKVKEAIVDPTSDIQRVNCVHLSPPLEMLKRWHCDMGDGRKGDCFIFLKREESSRSSWTKVSPNIVS